MFDRPKDVLARAERLKALEEKLEQVHQQDLARADEAIEAAQDLNRRMQSRRLDPQKLYLKVSEPDAETERDATGAIFVRIQQICACPDDCGCQRKTA